jgi:hypothetical protein
VYSGLVCFVLCYITIEFTYTERYVVVHICTAGTVTYTVYRIVLLCKPSIRMVYTYMLTHVYKVTYTSRVALPIVYT